MNNTFTFLNPVEVSMEGPNNRRQRMYIPLWHMDLFPQLRNEVCMEFRRLNQFFPTDKKITLSFEVLTGEYEGTGALVYHPYWPHHEWGIVINTASSIVLRKMYHDKWHIDEGFYTGDPSRCSYQRTIAHEYGHILAGELDLQDQPPLDWPSWAGSVNWREAWAEAFVEVVHTPKSKWSLTAHVFSKALRKKYWR